MIRIEFTDEAGVTVKLRAPDDRAWAIVARAAARIHGEGTADGEAAEAKRWAELKAKWERQGAKR